MCTILVNLIKYNSYLKIIHAVTRESVQIVHMLWVISVCDGRIFGLVIHRVITPPSKFQLKRLCSEEGNFCLNWNIRPSGRLVSRKNIILMNTFVPRSCEVPGETLFSLAQQLRKRKRLKMFLVCQWRIYNEYNVKVRGLIWPYTRHIWEHPKSTGQNSKRISFIILDACTKTHV